MPYLSIWPICTVLTAVLASLCWLGWSYFLPRACKHWKGDRAECHPAPHSHPRLKHPNPALQSNIFRLRALASNIRSSQAWWLLVPLVVVGLIVAVTLSLSKQYELAPLRVQTLAEEGQANLRLNQEKLLPPPSLPPSMFIKTEFPHLETADRDWDHLEPVFAQAVYRLLNQMSKRGYPMALLEGYRSPERQERLAAKGSAVTLAKAGQSKHQYGLAVDLAPMRDGFLVISERDSWAYSAYMTLGEEAARLGLTWGGNWTRITDYGHVESPIRIDRRSIPNKTLQ